MYPAAWAWFRLRPDGLHAAMPEGPVILDRDGRVVVFNPPALWLLDLPAGSLRIGAPMPEDPIRTVVSEIAAPVMNGDRSYAEGMVPTTSARMLKVGAMAL